MAQIEVSIKIRPLIGKETGDSRLWVIPDENQIVQCDPQTKSHRGETYCFDHVFSERCSNGEVFDIVSKSIVDAAVNGFNGTIFAYGQTSSGKTHTMRGSPKDPGIIQLAVEHVFDLIGQKLDREFLLRVSYIEIYNETVNDLLKRENVNLKVKEENGQVIIPNVTEETETTIPGIIGLLERGENNRRIAETCMNDRSSRSHAIFRLIIESKGIDDAVQVSQLNLVDLAGSERTGLSGLTGSTFKEGIHINKSLTVLGKVIKDLSENPEGFINYRDSKLTRILQPALGGNALTAIICTVAPASADYTTSTLGFAQRAKKIKNKPKVNEVLSKDAHIKRMHLKMAELQAELDAFKGSKTMEDHAFNEEKLKHLQKLENMFINGTVGSHQSSSEIKQKSKRRQTWCDTKSFKQARKSVGTLSTITPSRNPTATQMWSLQSIQEQDSFASGSTDDNADCLSQFNGDGLEEIFTSSPPAIFGTPAAVSGFVTTKRGSGSRYHSMNVDTPPNLLREKADAYYEDLQSLKKHTSKEKEINDEELLEKLKQIEAENLKLKKELAHWETSKFEIEFEQEKKLEKAQQRSNELQSSLQSAWSSQADIEIRASTLEAENKALLSKIELMSQTERDISEKAIQTNHDDQNGSADKNGSLLLKDRLDRHKLSLLKEIISLNPKFEVDDPANSDEGHLLGLLLSTVTEKEQIFFSNLTDSYDSKERVLSNEVNSLKQTIEQMENERADLKGNEDLRSQEFSKDFESLLEEKQRTISQLEQELAATQEHVLQISERINEASSNELIKDKDEQITELQTKLLAAIEGSSLQSELISDLEKKLLLSQNQLQEKMIHFNDSADESFQKLMFIPNSEQIDTKPSLNDEVMEQYSQQITDLQLKLSQVEKENLHKIEIIDKFETEQMKMKNLLEENEKTMAELELSQGNLVNTLQAKLVEVENLLQEKALTILDLERKLSASSNEDSQETQVDDFNSKIEEMESLLQEKVHIIVELTKKLSADGTEVSKDTQIDDFKAKLAETENLLEEKIQIIAELEKNRSVYGNDEVNQLSEMEDLLQEKMRTILELESKLSAFSAEHSEETHNTVQASSEVTISNQEEKLSAIEHKDLEESQIDCVKINIVHMEHLLQEKMQIISDLEDKLSAQKDSQHAQISVLSTKLTETGSLLQEKILAIGELELKLFELGNKDSQETRMDGFKVNIADLENCQQEKVPINLELESKLSAFNDGDRQDTQIDTYRAKMTEMENLLQEKMFTISKLEEQLSAFNNIDLQESFNVKIVEMENLLQEKLLTIAELEDKLSAANKLGDLENIIQENLRIIANFELDQSTPGNEELQQTQAITLQTKLAEMEILLEERMVTITELKDKLSSAKTEYSQLWNNESKAQVVEMENIPQEKMPIIADMEEGQSTLSNEDSQQTQVITLQAKLAEMEILLQEKMVTIVELEESQSTCNPENAQRNLLETLQNKLTETENLLQEKMSTIAELEPMSSRLLLEDCQEYLSGGLQAKIGELENSLQEKLLTIANLESKLAEFSTEDSQLAHMDTLQAKLIEVESLLQEKVCMVNELESKLSELSSEDSRDVEVDALQTKLMEVESLLQEKVRMINVLELKLSEVNGEDSHDVEVDALHARLIEVESLLQEKVLMINELESKLSELSSKDSHDIGVDTLQAKLVEVESLLEEKVLLIDELESKLSEVNGEDSHDVEVDALQTKLMEVESLLKEKVLMIDELESKLSEINGKDSHDVEVDALQAKLMELETLLEEKVLLINELESKLSELRSIDQGTQMNSLKFEEEILYQESVLNISQANSKLSEAGQYDNSSPRKSLKLADSVVNLHNSHEERLSFAEPSPSFLETIEKVMGMELSPCLQNHIQNVPGYSESDAAEMKSACANIQHTRIEDFELRTKVSLGLAETSECETQTEFITRDQSSATDVCEVSEDERNIIHALEDQLEKISNELVFKREEIENMQTLLSDKSLTIETLQINYSKIDSEFKSFAENSVVVKNKLHAAESELISKLQCIAVLETKLNDNSRTTDDLKENLSSCDASFNKYAERIKLLEDQLIKVKASLKENREENERLQKALFEKASLVEDLEAKCSEQEVRCQEQSARFQLLEEKLLQVKADFKSSTNQVCSLQDDLKENSLFIEQLQSHASDVNEKLLFCSNQIQELNGELIRKSSVIESLEAKTKTSAAHLKESLETVTRLEEEREKQILEIESVQEKLGKLENVEKGMKKTQENDQFTIQCLKEKIDSMKKELGEKVIAIEKMSNKIDTLHKSLEDNVVVIRSLTEKLDCSKNDLQVKLHEIKLLNNLMEKQSKTLSENSLTIQNLEEKSAFYEKDSGEKLEMIEETKHQINQQRIVLEERANIIRNLEESLATRPDKKDLEKQSAVICRLQLQLAAQEESIKEHSKSLNTAKELQDQVLNLEKTNNDIAESNRVLIEKLEAATQRIKEMDIENEHLNSLWLETDKLAADRERELEADIEKLTAELGLSKTSLDAAKGDIELLNANVTKCQSLQGDLTNCEKELLTLQMENKILKENVKLSVLNKQALENELESLKRTTCECKSLKNRVKGLLKDLENKNLELVQRNGEFAGLELQIMKEEFPHKNAAEQLKRENSEMKDMIKTLKSELRRMEVAAPNETTSACQVCLGKPRTKESPLVPANPTKLQDNRSEDLERVCIALQEKNQLYKRIAHDRMVHIIKLEKEKETLVPGFKSRYGVNSDNKENK